MIHFNEIRLSPDSKCLIIEAEIDCENYYKDVYIENIIIDNQESFVPNGPSSKPLFSISYNTDISQGEVFKKVRLELSSKDVGVPLSENMFFIYVVANGVPAIDTPCGWDTNIIMNTVVDLHKIYNTSLIFLKELNVSCNIPKGFIDYILRIKALELNIKTGHYLEAIKIWKRLFANIYATMPITNCNCNGRT